MRLKYQFGEFELNPATRELLRNGSPVALRPRSLECICYLIEHRDRAVGRDELIAAVWGRVDVADTVVAQTLLRARKALDDTADQQGMIRTLPRFGYRWVAPVQEVPISSDAQVDEERAVEVDVEPEAEAESDDIEEVVAPTTPTTPKRRFRWPVTVVLLLAIAIAIGAWFHLRPRETVPPVLANDAVLVMPVAVVPNDSETAWVRLGAMDYMAARLRSSGINVLPSEQALRLGASIEGDAPAEARRKLFALSGARRIAQPEAMRESDGWRVRLRLLDADAERFVEARGDSPLAAAAGAADAWLRELGRQGEAAPPPDALVERLHRIDAEILAGRLPEARRLVRSSSPAERRDPRFLLREARLEFRAANLDTAGKLFQQALDAAPAADVQTKVGALVGLGTVARAGNDPDVADQRFTQSLALLESMPADRVDSRMVGVTYMGRGIIRAQRGELDAGVKDMGQARVWIQRSGDLITLGVIGHNLGKAEAMRGDYLQALHEFDRSIETFQRFHVEDYLANSLHEKAAVQLALARPAEAWDTIHRADAHLPKLEDDGLASEILAVRAKVLIASGRTREAGDTLVAMRARGVQDDDPRLLELRMRVHLARGEFAQARQLAASGPAAEGVGGGLRLAAVQSALRSRDIPLARKWLAAASRPDEQEQAAPAFALELARALVARAAGEPSNAVAQAEKAAAQVGSRASPDVEIRAGVMQAMTLLDARQSAAASAIMGELEKHAATDYRVAWVMATLYRALDDPRAAASAIARAKSLAGERDTGVEPIL